MTTANNEMAKESRELKARFLTTGAARIVSRLSSKSIIENTSDDCFLVPRTWSQKGCAAAVGQWKAGEKDKSHRAWTREFISKVNSLAQMTSREDFCRALEEFVPLSGEDTRKTFADGFRACIVELMMSLWSKGCLIWPKANGPLGVAPIKNGSRSWGGSLVLVQDVMEALRVSDERQTIVRFRAFAKFLLSRSPTDCVKDICPDSVQKQLAVHERSAFIGAISGVIKLQREAEPLAELHTAGDYFVSAPKINRLDPKFVWASGKRKGIDIWRDEAAAFLETKRTGRERAIYAMNSWLDYMIKHTDVPTVPIELFDSSKRGDYPALLSGARHQSKVNASIAEFLGFVMKRHCSIDDEEGRAFVPPMFQNPIGIPPAAKTSNQVETQRTPMPTRIINLCAQILTENDFAWPKRKTLLSADWFKWRNPETGKWEATWSPVCATAILLKLLLPMRTYQLRMLDSGEADTERYTSGDNHWEPNLGHLATAKKPNRAESQKGVFRKYQRKDGSFGSLLFFNTNKTADADQPVDRRGYVMPWEHEQALTLFANLRDWQEKYNPLAAPTPWASVPELSSRHPDELAGMGAACFLFRDPTNTLHPSFPITDGRLRGMWLALLSEAESRLRAAGEKSASGGEIKLVTQRTEWQVPERAIFDLHSLRVSIITALYEQGMPPEFIMKIVGHASVLMTLYYVKIHSDDIALAINQAEVKRQESAQDQWLGYLEKLDADALKPLVAHCHETGLQALSNASAAGMITMSHGICPVGGRRCSEGLASASPVAGSFNAVPGLASNCVSCRFFVTGPAFLIGLEAHFNDLSYRARAAALAYQNAQDTLDTLSDQQAIAAESGVPFEHSRHLRKAEAGAEISKTRTDELALRMHATYRLVEQCLNIASAPETDKKFSLMVANGGVETLYASLSETHEIEQLQKVCESAAMFEDLQIDSTRPNLERMRFFDRMLADAGLKPAFCLIKDEKVALRVANEMGRLLYAAHTSREVAALADGLTTLRQLGFKNFPCELELGGPKNVMWLGGEISNAKGQTGGVSDQNPS